METSNLALNTATLGHNIEGHGAGLSPEAVIDLVASKGLAGVVFWRREIGNAQQVANHARDAGVAVLGLCRTPYLIGSQTALGELQASIDMAATLQAPVLTIVTGGVEPGTKGIAPSLDILRKRLEPALPIAADAGVTLALEPLNPVYAGNRSALVRTRDALDIVLGFDDDHLKVAIDVYHVWWDLDLADALAKADGRVAGFHLCDWLEHTETILLDRGMMGDGVADIPAIRKLVEATGYTGPHEVEIFSADNWWKRPPAEVVDTMVERYHECC